MLEFEVKAPVPAAEAERVRRALGPPRVVEEQEDVYLAHPARDFGRTDEALRLRTVEGRAELTYKGPKLDRATKTRVEVTAALADAAATRRILESLGFTAVARVRKRRGIGDYAGFEASFDEVEGLGAFVELERALPEGASTEEAEREALAALERLGLRVTERRSYLELLLASRTR